ncbi:hypothetical protein [Bacillus sp. MUM 13]|uniref:hypothetical protein n=1 Tax=Bacillus sp. MUM 13 TaxID=1678001 RepID=UPI0008F5D5BD|nr:hypothetical protein [Bacillus sp. MUM 13]OIK07147.1 hypothetical protein BIV59_21185 [Bacillus sp. MUM 13]
MIKKLFTLRTTYLFVFCIIDVLIYQLLLVNIPAPTNLVYGLGDIQYRICFSFITSYIFYVLMTFLPKENDKKNVYSYVEPKKDKLVESSNTFFGLLVEHVTNYKSTDPKMNALHKMLFYKRELDPNNLSQQDIEDICHLIQSGTLSPIHKYSLKEFVRATWGEFLQTHADSVKDQISDIFVLMPHLNTKHIKLLTDINDSEFIRICHLGKIFDLLETEPDIYVLKNPLYDYYQLIFNLKTEW